MNFISLFAGIGGFDLGLERAGMDCAGQVESDPYALKVLDHHWPTTDRHGEIRGFHAGTTDVLCGGFPCQDVSVIGKLAGLHGTQSGLWFEFERVIAESRPRIVLIENVVGLLSSNKGKDIGTILRSLEGMGYEWAFRVLDSQYFGVPQRRRRVFIVGSLGNTSCRQILFEPESTKGNSQEIRRPEDAPATRVDDPPQSLHENQRGELRLSPVAYPLTTGGGKPGQGYPAVATAKGIRRLTPVECERLQGFPDGWTKDISDSRRYKALGNAVSVPVIEWLGRRIVDNRYKNLEAYEDA